MNTIIIDKILVHMLDIEHNKIIYSDDFIELEEHVIEYYEKKLEKALGNSSIKELIIGSQHPLLVNAKSMLESKEAFLKEATKITQDIYQVCHLIEEMPNSNLMFYECKVDGIKYIVIIKLNYKMMPMSIIQEVDGKRTIKVINQQVLPPKTLNVEEAIIINTEANTISLIEKRFLIDGKPGYYLNEQYIKGEPKLTDKQKMSILNKTIKKVDSEFNVIEGDPLPLVKKEVVDLVLNHQPVKPMSVAKKVVEKDYQALEEVEMILKDLGIEEDDEIVNVPVSVDRMGRCKLYLDDDKTIELNVEDYVSKKDIIQEMDENGMLQITIKNIHELTVK